MSAKWVTLGLQLGVRVGTLDSIRSQFSGSKNSLREMLITWLRTSDNASWKTLINALKSRSVGEHQLASDLERKYCPVEGTELERGIAKSHFSLLVSP